MSPMARVAKKNATYQLNQRLVQDSRVVCSFVQSQQLGDKLAAGSVDTGVPKLDKAQPDRCLPFVPVCAT